MKSTTLSWTKIEKSLEKIDGDLNRLLSKIDFKIATHNQSSVKGRMVVTLFYEDKPGKVRAKCFKDQSYKDLDKRLNDFIADRKVKYVTQSFIGSNIYTIVYYEATKEEIDKESFDHELNIDVPLDNDLGSDDDQNQSDD